MGGSLTLPPYVLSGSPTPFGPSVVTPPFNPAAGYPNVNFSEFSSEIYGGSAGASGGTISEDAYRRLLGLATKHVGTLETESVLIPSVLPVRRDLLTAPSVQIGKSALEQSVNFFSQHQGKILAAAAVITALVIGPDILRALKR